LAEKSTSISKNMKSRQRYSYAQPLAATLLKKEETEEDQERILSMLQ
jgi:hypothetical protein